MTEQRYSARYRAVPCFEDIFDAQKYLSKRMAHIKRTHALSESDGWYVYRADAQGNATGSPLAGFQVSATTAAEGGRIPTRNNSGSNGGGLNSRSL